MSGSDAPWATDRTLRSRFECKYLVSESLAREIVHAARPFLELDYFSARTPGHRYPVHSLYLDSAGHELYRTTKQGMKNRFKLRIRGYDGKPESPLFAEVKRRADRVILKRRALISRGDGHALLRGGALPANSLAKGADFAEFRSLTARLAAMPTVVVSYLREAYEAMGPEPVRLTLDTELRHAAPERHRAFAFEELRYHPTPCPGVILELKFTDACPQWVEQLIRRFRLDRLSVAKYILCLEALAARQQARRFA